MRTTLPALSRRSLLGLAVALTAGSARAAPPAGAPVVTLLGDSITAGLGLPARDALPARLQEALARRGVRAVVRGAGVSGDTSAGGLARVDFSVQADTAVCVVELGANDYLQSVDPRETERNLTAIVQRLKARRIKVLLAAGSAPAKSAGSYGRAFKQGFTRIAAREHVALSPDLLAGVADRPELRQADGLHPNARGVLILADRLAGPLAKLLGRSSPAAGRAGG